MAIIKDEQIGGGWVRRGFQRGAERLNSGKPLTRAEVLAIPQANRQALVDNGFIEIYPPAALGAIEAPAADVERIVVSRGFKRYDVIEGRKLNDTFLTKDEAAKLAVEGRPTPN